MTTIPEVKTKIDEKNQEIHRLTDQIENRIEEFKDWRGMVNRYPLRSIGVAVVGGLLLSGAMGPALNKGRHAGGALVKNQLKTAVQSAVMAAVSGAVAKKQANA